MTLGALPIDKCAHGWPLPMGCSECAALKPLTKSQRNKRNRVRRLSLPMIHHLLSLCDDAEQEGSYYGNKEQYWKRHRRIVKWLEAIRDRRLDE